MFGGIKQIAWGALFGCLIATQALGQATLLPNAKQQFFTPQGIPAAAGTVDFYIPSTTTRKTTWKSSSETVGNQNTNPVLLDAGGFAQIYGDGQYRQVVKDVDGNPIWDAVTASTGGGSGPTPPTTVGDGIAVGTVVTFNGFVAPANYMFAAGQAISRTTYSALLAAITTTQSIVSTSGTNIISNFSDTSQLSATMPVECSCLAPGTTITAVNSPTTVTVSANATISGVFNLQVFPSGRGDGSTTFNIPDLRGRAIAGRDNMAGTPANRITSAFFVVSGQGIGQSGGFQSATLGATNVPPYTPAGTITNGAITSTFTGTAGQAALTSTGGAQAFTTGSFASQQVTGTVASSQAASSFTGTPSTGVSAPFSIIQPTQLSNLLIKVFPDSLSSDATWQVPLNAIPVGRGTGTGFNSVSPNVSIVPKYLQQSGDGVTASAPIWGTLNQFFAVPTMAGLRGLVAGAANNVYLQGYYGPGDGGEGQVYWDISSTCTDNGGTCIIPDSLPAAGRWIRTFTGKKISVQWFGAACGISPVTNNAAIAATVVTLQFTAGGRLYFPACPTTGGFYLGNVSMQDAAISIIGDGGLGSRLIGALNTNTVDLFSNSGCGNTHDWVIEGMYIGASGTTGIGLRIKNAGWIAVRDSRVDGPTAIKIECASQGVISNVQGYSSGGPGLQVIAGGSNSGPIAVSGGQFTNNGGSSPAIVLVDPLSMVFNGTAYSVANGTATASISVDGTAGDNLGSATFKEMHAESNYNTTNTMADYEIGKTFKTGAVKIEGGTSWGLGDGAHSQQDFVRIFAARDVSVRDVITSKLAGTGYTRSMIRLESTFPAAGDQYRFENNVADITGTLYSDANGTLTGATGDATNQNLNLGKGKTLTFPGATSGAIVITPPAISGTSTLTWPAATDTLVGKATTDIFTNKSMSGSTNTFTSIPNSGLVNSATTVNGQTCTLGASCTVTAAATGVVVGTTTVGSGTSHGVLTNNAGVLGNTAIGTNGQLFLGVSSAEPNWGTMSGDATITNAGVVTFASTIAAGGPTGSATVAPIITYDAKGRLTTVSSATITPAASSITGGAALSKVDDTNVTLTLGGSPTTALLTATSITAGWTGTLANARLATMATNTVKGNATSGTASPTDLAVGTCSTAASALIWTTNTGFGCNTSITANTATTATTATNATNGATVATSTNASFFPLFAASSTNSNQPFNLDTTLTYNPSTDTLTSANFSGNASTASTASVATTTTITDDVVTSAVMFPTWVTTATGNQSQKTSSTLFTWNPGTVQMKVGSGADASTAGGAAIYATNAGTTSVVARDSTNDVEVSLLAASFGGLTGTLSSSPFALWTNNTARLTISNAGVFTFNTIPAADTATTDNTLCVSTTGVILKGTGTLGICLGTSSARYKHDIITMGAGLAEIVRLDPKNFFYKKGWGDDGARLQYGFIAEDVVKVLPGVTSADNKGKPNSVDMVAMIPVLVNAVKQLKADNDNLRMDVQALQAKGRK